MYERGAGYLKLYNYSLIQTSHRVIASSMQRVEEKSKK